MTQAELSRDLWGDESEEYKRRTDYFLFSMIASYEDSVTLGQLWHRCHFREEDCLRIKPVWKYEAP